ncbi:GGDEF domain-containing protein [Altererythrobacter sp. KTW20L]|uniref:diguanylate cyclase domain-containing protein n=1 Tax=Altererythrobacter sp. KTW20L TaxID=2942210 RepID=UPI0020C1361E|nr:GGDEF domain-containing protein [Altererythrobacter sp. KTW20L]MCL6251617.1 GGDEF domain-containing protein [Altererythrobacter sp. KTW20L]
MAMHDPLTGLINRRRMGVMLEQVLSSYRHRGKPCATMLIDLDRFKQVNDTLGHTAGDSLLKLVADRLISVVGDR